MAASCMGKVLWHGATDVQPDPSTEDIMQYDMCFSYKRLENNNDDVECFFGADVAWQLKIVKYLALEHILDNMYTQNYTIAHVDFLVPNFVFGFFHGFADDDAWVDLESSLWPWWVWPSLQWTWAMSWRVKMEKERQGGNHWTGIGRLETLKTLNLGAFDSESKTLQDTMKKILKVQKTEVYSSLQN